MSYNNSVKTPFIFSANEIEKGIVIIDIEGPVNSRHSPMLREAIQKSFNKKKSIVIINMEKLEYMDSSGLATIVEGLQLAEATRGKFVLAGAINQKIMHLFEISRLDNLFEYYASVDEAKIKLMQPVS